MIRIFRTGIHTGEEPWVPGNDRAGMIVLSGCHLRCSYCYTPETSRRREGVDHDGRAFRHQVRDLQERGAKNLNFITPTHVFRFLGPWLQDLRDEIDLPVVLKITGYESTAQIEAMAELAQHLVFDFKVGSSSAAIRSDLPSDYPEVAAQAIVRAQSHGIPTTVRHLLVPGEDDDSIAVLESLGRIRFRGPVNLMTRFARPDGRGLAIATSARVQALVRFASSRGLRPAVDGKECHDHLAA